MAQGWRRLSLAGRKSRISPVAYTADIKGDYMHIRVCTCAVLYVRVYAHVRIQAFYICAKPSRDFLNGIKIHITFHQKGLPMWRHAIMWQFNQIWENMTRRYNNTNYKIYKIQQPGDYILYEWIVSVKSKWGQGQSRHVIRIHTAGAVCHHHITVASHERHGPLARYVKLRVAHAPRIPGTFSPPPRISYPSMHHGTCVTHVPWCIPGSLTSGSLWSQWRGKRSRHSHACTTRNFTYLVRGPCCVNSLVFVQ